jgi:hypothetical protein
MDGNQRSQPGNQRKQKLSIASEQSRSLGARWIHSMLAPPLENHWINITEDNVESISVSPAYTPQHLGDPSVILPAAVNAHAHLELTQLTSPLEVPSRSMSDWVTALLAFRRSPGYNAAEGIRHALCRPELLESTIAVADIVPLPTDQPEGLRLPLNFRSCITPFVF